MKKLISILMITCAVNGWGLQHRDIKITNTYDAEKIRASHNCKDNVVMKHIGKYNAFDNAHHYKKVCGVCGLDIVEEEQNV